MTKSVVALCAILLLAACAPPFWPEQSACKSEPVKGACRNDLTRKAP